MFDLTDKVAVVTGAASGIGLATVRRLHAAGAQVVVADLTDARHLAEELEGLFVRTDVSDEDQVASLMAEAADRFGKVDIVVNNAGIAIDAGEFVDHQREDYLKQFEVNLLGPVYGIKHGVAHMPDGGSIVNVSSMAGMIGHPEMASYAASKWALVGVTKVAAAELAARGIRVNAVCPTNLRHGMAAADPEAMAAARAVSETLQPIGRLGTPEEVAAAIHYLVSDEAAMITGLALPIDGGLAMGVAPQAIDLAVEQSRGETEP